MGSNGHTDLISSGCTSFARMKRADDDIVPRRFQFSVRMVVPRQNLERF